MKTKTANDEPKCSLGVVLRANRLVVTVELLIILLIIVMQSLGILKAAIIFLLLISSLSLWLRGISWRKLGLKRPLSWKYTLSAGFAAGIVYQVFSIGIVAPLAKRIMGQPPNVSSFSTLQGNFLVLGVALVGSWILGGLFEELVFRGYVLDRLADYFGHTRLGWVLSVCLSAAMFGWAHYYQGIAGVVDNFLFGLVLASLYLVMRRNLWAPIITHGVLDTLGFSLIFLGLYP